MFLGQDNDFAPFAARHGELLGKLIQFGVEHGFIENLFILLRVPAGPPFAGVVEFPPLIGLDGGVAVNDVPINGLSYLSTDAVRPSCNRPRSTSASRCASRRSSTTMTESDDKHGPKSRRFRPVVERSLRAARRSAAHDAAEPEVAGRGVDRLRKARGRPVAAAVVGRAQVRAALDHLARNADRRLPRIVAVVLAAPRGLCGVQQALTASSGCLARTSRSSTPRRCRSCRGGRSRSAETRRPVTCPRIRRSEGSATGTRPATCSPCDGRRERARRPTRRRRRRARRARPAPTPPRSAAPCLPTPRTPPRRRRRRAPRDGVRGRRVEASGPCGCRQSAPFMNVHQLPMLRRSTGPSGRTKTSEPAYSMSGSAPGYWAGSGGISANVTCAGRLDEAREALVGHRIAVDPEPVHRHAVHRTLFGIVLVRAHLIGRRRDPDHVGERRSARARSGGGFDGWLFDRHRILQ